MDDRMHRFEKERDRLMKYKFPQVEK